MRDFLRRLFIGFLALAFIASGATWRQCIAAPQGHATSVSVPAHSEHASHHEQSAGHDHHHAAVDDTKKPVDDHACLKCCSMCTAATVTPFVADRIVIFTVSSIVFSVASANLFGRAVLVDPGIPKHLV